MRATDPGAKRGKGSDDARRGQSRDGAARPKARGDAARRAAPAAAGRAAASPAAETRAAVGRAAEKRAAAGRAAETRAAGKGAIRVHTANEGAAAKAAAAKPVKAQSVVAPADTLVDRLTGAWGAIVVERIAADQDFAVSFERYSSAPRDLRAVFAWDEVLSAEAHLSLVNGIIAKHSDDAGRADPFAILRDLHEERRRLAAVYAVNAFRAVLGQMSPRKARWREMEGGDFDERIAVLALAHQALAKALEIARVPAPTDLTERTLDAAQDRAVWAVRRSGPEGLVLAALQAASVFFARLGAETFADAREIGRLYAVHPPRG